MSGPGEEGRYARQAALFGDEGQRFLERAKVAVFGLGGLGSHVCQQMAYLGVRRFVLADDDPVDLTNLNRLVGATPDDIGEPKTIVAERLVRSIQPEASIVVVDKKLPHPEVDAAAQGADLIFGCFDNDYPRLLVTSMASRLKIPYIDAASGVELDQGPAYGGRVICAGITPGCLYCLGLLDQNEIRRAQMSDEELEVEARIYGVPVESLRGTGPSVVTINGVVASLATTEAMVLLTGLRQPKKQLIYRGHLGTITSSTDQPLGSCAYCAAWLES